jgi:hypothetical protein
MKRLENRHAFLLSLLMLIVIGPNVQAQSEEQLARFEEDKIKFFTEELQLTEEESTVFWPVYNDYSNRKMAIMEEERNLLRYFRSNKENMSDTEITESLNTFMEIWEKKHALEIEYHDTFKKILPERKVMMIYIAERQFRMHLVKRLRGHGQGNQGGTKRGSGQKRDYRTPPPEAPTPELF